jgi:hypothetical protein
MYSGYNQQVEHVSSFANKTKKKKHEIACEGIEPQFFTLQNSTQYSTSCLKKKTKQHPQKQQTTSTPQNRSPRNQKPLATC